MIWVGLGQTFAQFDFRMAYEYNPTDGMMTVNIRRVHNINLMGLVQIPKTPLKVGLELTAGGYGHQKTRQTYTFPDDPDLITDVDVHVNNNVTGLLLATQIELPNSKIFHPYMHIAGGFSRFGTSLNIYDDNDLDHCEPLESNVLLADNTLIGKFGLGLKWDLSSLFNKIDKNFLFFDMAAQYTFGGNVRYMNVKGPDPHQNHNLPRDPQSVEISFQNTQTQVVHKHHVGYVYESPIRMYNLKFGLAINFNR
jgi:hypothetical protein